MRYEQVSISNPSFFIANIMKDCPAKTVIRELLQNAIEASGRNRIEWFSFDFHGTPKLGLYNEGAGMDYRELNERMNIASTGKELGFNKNFGQGAKMSAGKASPYGLIYRSCKGGIVSEIWLQVVDSTDGGKTLVKVEQLDEYEGEEVIVRQVTDDAAERGRRIDVDWTEAILLGRTKEDNTLKGEFLGEDSSLWLSKLINRRYYKFPEGVTIHCSTVTTNRTDFHRNARGLLECLSSPKITERKESVFVAHPQLGSIEIVYGKLAGKAKDRRGGPLAADGLSGGSHACLVWLNEIYDFDMNWIFQAGSYGFSGASHDYYIHVLISDTSPVENNNHRTEILFRGINSEKITCAMFCNLIRENRPDWVIEDIKRRMDDDNSGKLQERIRRMAEKFKAWMDTRVVSDDGAEDGALEFGPGDGKGGVDGPSSNSKPNPGGPLTRRHIGKPRPDRPRPETLVAKFRSSEDVQWYEGIGGHAGKYDIGENTIHLSEVFVDFKRLMAWVNQLWNTPEENAIAVKVLRDEYCLFACSLGIAALSFRNDPSWSPDQWMQGLSSEAISCHMRDPAGAVRNAVKKYTHSKINARIRENGEAVCV